MARYKMRQRLLSIGEDFEIEDERGDPVYRVDGKVLRIRETFVIEDLAGHEVATIREKKIALRDTMNVLRGGEVVATIRKAWVTPFRDKFGIEVQGGQDMAAQGNILDHEYEIRQGGETVARVSKHWFTIRDTYGIEVASGHDDGLILAIAVAIDEMAHDPDEGKG
ncbi:MAG TPA: LURP-one-related family protein [Thermoanaerobaculia bacterium]|nr:LURP-one-related family protein [Thermoanaerobaculia bacterium]